MGSYSTVITFPGISYLSRLKSINLYLLLCPPPLRLIVILPVLFLPPLFLRALVKLFSTAFEVEPKYIVESASRRQKWIDQAQSLNLYIGNANGKKLDLTYRMAWYSGLKTTYYLRSKAATRLEKSTVQTVKEEVPEEDLSQVKACSLDDPDCESWQ